MPIQVKNAILIEKMLTFWDHFIWPPFPISLSADLPKIVLHNWLIFDWKYSSFQVELNLVGLPSF